MAELVLSFLAWAAKQEHVRISERTKAGLERVRANGTKLGRPKMHSFDLKGSEAPTGRGEVVEPDHQGDGAPRPGAGERGQGGERGVASSRSPTRESARFLIDNTLNKKSVPLGGAKWVRNWSPLAPC